MADKEKNEYERAREQLEELIAEVKERGKTKGKSEVVLERKESSDGS